MVKMFGMSDSVGMVNYGDDTDQPFLGYSIASGRDYSDDTAAKLDAEIKRIIDVAYQETRELLEDHREGLDQLAAALLEKETVEREEILRILGIEDDVADFLPETVAKHLREPQPVASNGSDTSEDSEVEQ
jgi:cell division protease FtsH